MFLASGGRCVGYMMAKMVLRELMDPAIFSLVKNFLTQGHDPAGLREFFSSLVKSASGNTGVQILDRDGGAGWNLLACMLTNKSAERIRYSQLPLLPWFLHIYISIWQLDISLWN
jgi:hypothetical protein